LTEAGRFTIYKARATDIAKEREMKKVNIQEKISDQHKKLAELYKELANAEKNKDPKDRQRGG
jgi:hypothetical protein